MSDGSFVGRPNPRKRLEFPDIISTMGDPHVILCCTLPQDKFLAGSIPGSINIPLPEIGARAAELDRSRPVIVCCASGTRSAVAAHRLRKQGFSRVINGGSWRTLA